MSDPRPDSAEALARRRPRPPLQAGPYLGAPASALSPADAGGISLQMSVDPAGAPPARPLPPVDSRVDTNPLQVFGIPTPAAAEIHGRATGSVRVSTRNRIWRRIDWTFVAIVLICTVLGGAGGGGWGSMHPPQFAGRADFVVDATVDLTGGDSEGQATDRDVSTQAALLGNQAVHDTAAGYLGWSDFRAKTTSDHDSNMLSVTVVAPTPARAKQARAAYMKGYLQLLAIQQRRLLEPQLDVAEKAIRSDQKQLNALDAALEATKLNQRGLLLSQQGGLRSNLNADLRDNQQRQTRLKAAESSLPVNVQSLPVETPIERTGLRAWQWLALGLVLGAGAGAVLCLRLAERRTLVPS